MLRKTPETRVMDESGSDWAENSLWSRAKEPFKFNPKSEEGESSGGMRLPGRLRGAANGDLVAAGVSLARHQHIGDFSFRPVPEGVQNAVYQPI